MSDAPVTTSTPVPEATNPVGPTSVVDQARDLVAEKRSEQAADKAAVVRARPRFEARRVTSRFRPMTNDPVYETLIFASAVNNPLEELTYPSVSHFTPCFQVLFYLLNYMDSLMTSTKRWTDNCMGWVPPYSQMYISVLIFVQTFRAMDSAGYILPGSGISNFLNTFYEVFPLNELWIPGPLVALFRALSAFWPSASNRFGNVTPSVPTSPDWTTARRFCPRNNVIDCLPNTSVFISRLRSICAVATTAGMTDALFNNHTSGPNFLSTLFGRQLTHDAFDISIMSAPGSSFAYTGSLTLWQAAATRINSLSVPTDLMVTSNAFNDWTSFFRFSNFRNEHVWFGPVSAMMAKYCQFFKGSTPLGDCSPNSSAAGAVKCSRKTDTDIFIDPDWIDQAGNGTSHQHQDANQNGHYVLRNSVRLIIDATCAVEDIPLSHQYAGITFSMNLLTPNSTVRTGSFWTLAPDAFGRGNIELLPGVLSTIMREYHSDVRIDSSKQ